MIISLKTPVVLAAVEERTFSEIWISGLEISLLPGNPGSAVVSWQPWDAATNSFPPDARPRTFVVDNLVARLGSDTGFQAVWDAVTNYLAAFMAAEGIAAEI